MTRIQPWFTAALGQSAHQPECHPGHTHWLQQQESTVLLQHCHQCNVQNQRKPRVEALGSPCKNLPCEFHAQHSPGRRSPEDGYINACRLWAASLQITWSNFVVQWLSIWWKIVLILGLKSIGFLPSILDSRWIVSEYAPGTCAGQAGRSTVPSLNMVRKFHSAVLLMLSRNSTNKVEPNRERQRMFSNNMRFICVVGMPMQVNGRECQPCQCCFHSCIFLLPKISSSVGNYIRHSDATDMRRMTNNLRHKLKACTTVVGATHSDSKGLMILCVKRLCNCQEWHRGPEQCLVVDRLKKATVTQIWCTKCSRTRPHWYHNRPALHSVCHTARERHCLLFYIFYRHTWYLIYVKFVISLEHYYNILCFVVFSVKYFWLYSSAELHRLPLTFIYIYTRI